MDDIATTMLMRKKSKPNRTDVRAYIIALSILTTYLMTFCCSMDFVGKSKIHSPLISPGKCTLQTLGKVGFSMVLNNITPADTRLNSSSSVFKYYVFTVLYVTLSQHNYMGKSAMYDAFGLRPGKYMN